MKNKILVYEGPLSSEVMAEFDSPNSFMDWAKEKSNLFADQIEINGVMFLGWDEIEEALNKLA